MAAGASIPYQKDRSPEASLPDKRRVAPGHLSHLFIKVKLTLIFAVLVMPTKYKRKIDGPQRRQWTQESLVEALRSIKAGEMGINAAARHYGIPSRTLRRRRQTGIVHAIPLGPQGILGTENEKRLVTHIQKLEKVGFAPDRDTIRSLAYQFAEKIGIRHKFNRETQMAGYDWLESFLCRNKELSIRKSQGLSLARSEGMNRNEAKKFFDILTTVFTEFNMFEKPGNIFNMDETGYQINNEAGTVIATKGAKDVHTIISSERGENVSIIACCSAEGTFLPPVVIYKGVREKKEFGDGLPSGSKVFMNQKSSYITSVLFLRWLKEHFVPKKPPGRTVLILDGHSSHRNSLDMIDYAEENEITLICLPSHTTQALQPLDRSFFKSLKHNLKRESRQWILNHPSRRITRLQSGEIIGKAFGKSASVEIGLSGFRATGIFPLNPEAIPDHFYNISDEMVVSDDNKNSSTIISNLPSTSSSHAQLPGPSKRSALEIPGTSRPSESPEPRQSRSKSPELKISTSSESQEGTSKETPSKFLLDISPIPVVSSKQTKKRKQSAEILKPRNEKQFLTGHTNDKKPKGSTKKRSRGSSCSSSSSDDVPLASLFPQKKQPIKKKRSDSNYEQCIECLEPYFQTKEKVDWVQCVNCFQWMHETCTMYIPKCNICGRDDKRKEKAKTAMKQLQRDF